MNIYAIIAGLVLAGPSYQFVSTKIDQHRFPPIGEMVDVGGFKLHMHRTGPEQGPTVVLDMGCGGPGIHWDIVQNELSKFACCMSYDRAGLGWSEESSAERTCQQMAEELHNLLEKSGMPKPYIMVGQSLGGLNVINYAHQYPEDVSGIVLVDSTHENAFEYLIPAMRGSYLEKLSKPLTFFGITRLFYSMLLPPTIDSRFSKEHLKMLKSLTVSWKNMKTLVAESNALEKSSKISQKISKKLSVPITVITAGKMWPQGVVKKGYKSEELFKMWNQMHDDFASRSSQGKRVIAEKSGHMIHLEQPDIIVDEVRQMLSNLKS